MLATPTDVDYLTVSLNAGETLTLIGTPTTSSLQLAFTVLDPNSNAIASAAASAPGANVSLETITIATTGTYTIAISDVNGNTGLYSIQAYLNSYVKQGTSNLSIPTAVDLTSSSYLLGPGDADRLAAVGSLPDSHSATGDVFVVSRNYEYRSTTSILQINAAGQVVQTIPVNEGLWFSAGQCRAQPVQQHALRRR